MGKTVEELQAELEAAKREAEKVEEAKKDEKEEAADESVKLDLTRAKVSSAPDWFKVPTDPDFQLPKRKVFACLRFRAALTDNPKAGDRQCCVWGLSDGDERLAQGRAMGDSNRYLSELAKAFIRVIDGKVADIDDLAGPQSVSRFWDEIGPKYRTQLTRLWTQMNALSRAEQADFFARDFALVVPG